MTHDRIFIRIDDDQGIACTNAIIVTDLALAEAGAIKSLTIHSTAHAKHEFHALAQTALALFEDDELEIDTLSGPFSVEWKRDTHTVAAGVVLLRDARGRIRLVGNSVHGTRKMLQAAHRFCTRWVRLDI